MRAAHLGQWQMFGSVGYGGNNFVDSSYGDTVDGSEIRWSPAGMYKTLQVVGETTNSLVQGVSYTQYDEIWSDTWFFALWTSLKDEYQTDSCKHQTQSKLNF